jgi:hypothetical protein
MMWVSAAKQTGLTCFSVLCLMERQYKDGFDILERQTTIQRFMKINSQVQDRVVEQTSLPTNFLS